MCKVYLTINKTRNNRQKAYERQMFTLNPETMGDRRNRYCFLKNKKLLIKKKKKKATFGWWEVFQSSQPSGPLQVDGYHPQQIFLG